MQKAEPAMMRCNLMMFRHKQLDSPTLAWSSLQHLLENAVPHVLIILDCCFAANAARDTAEGTTKELLAACGRENPTSGVGERSFTSALIEELMAFGEAVRYFEFQTPSLLYLNLDIKPSRPIPKLEDVL